MTAITRSIEAMDMMTRVQAAPAGDETAASDIRAQDVETAIRAVSIETEGLHAVRRALGGELGWRLSQAVEILLRSTGRLIVTGMGKSGHIGRKIAATLASTGTPAHFVHPADASHGDLGMIRGEDAVLALSWSGESAELSDIVAYTRRFGVPLIAITSRADSALGRAADVALVLPRVQEACPNGLAPTTSTTAQLVIGDALAVCLLSRRNFTSQDFSQFHPGGKLGSKLRQARELMHSGDEVPLIAEDSMLSAAIFEMTSKRFGVTGIVDDAGRLIGVLSDGDLRRALKTGFHDRPVGEVMSRAPRTTTPDILAEQAMARLNAERITSLFVIENGRPIGILTVHDLLRAGVV
jgi:arabinose-5-phosphate isomerase